MSEQQKPELDWFEDTDDNGNSIWLLPSPYEVDDVTQYWRLKQKVVDNKILWYACHDETFWNKGEDCWLTLEEAKADVENHHLKLLAEIKLATDLLDSF